MAYFSVQVISVHPVCSLHTLPFTHASQQQYRSCKQLPDLTPGAQAVSLGCREVLDKQLFLLNNAILRTRDECVLVWELKLSGIEAGKVHRLQDLQASYKAAAKVLDPNPSQCITKQCILTAVHALRRFCLITPQCMSGASDALSACMKQLQCLQSFTLMSSQSVESHVMQ